MRVTGPLSLREIAARSLLDIYTVELCYLLFDLHTEQPRGISARGKKSNQIEVTLFNCRLYYLFRAVGLVHHELSAVGGSIWLNIMTT